MIDWLRDPADPVVALAHGDLPLVIRRHPRARRMTLRLSLDGQSAQVTTPRWGTTREAVRFAQARADWLEAQRAKRPAAREPEPGGTVDFRGETLTIDWCETHPRRVRSGDGVVALGGPREGMSARLKRWTTPGGSMKLTMEFAHVGSDRSAEPNTELSQALALGAI